MRRWEGCSTAHQSDNFIIGNCCWIMGVEVLKIWKSLHYKIAPGKKDFPKKDFFISQILCSNFIRYKIFQSFFTICFRTQQSFAKNKTTCLLYTILYDVMNLFHLFLPEKQCSEVLKHVHTLNACIINRINLLNTSNYVFKHLAKLLSPGKTNASIHAYWLLLHLSMKGKGKQLKLRD